MAALAEPAKRLLRIEVIRLLSSERHCAWAQLLVALARRTMAVLMSLSLALSGGVRWESAAWTPATVIWPLPAKVKSSSIAVSSAGSRLRPPWLSCLAKHRHCGSAKSALSQDLK